MYAHYPGMRHGIRSVQIIIPFSVRIVSQLVIPVGRDWIFFTLGAGSAITAIYRMPFLPMLFAGADVEYSRIPISGDLTSLSLLNGGIITGLKLDIASIFGLRFFGAAGGITASSTTAAETAEASRVFSAAVCDLPASPPVGMRRYSTSAEQ